MAKPAPYPPTSFAGNAGLLVEVARALGSDTWAKASDDERHWLWSIWLLSWVQVPMGSWQDDDEVIARKIGVSLARFRKSRHVLMRGWKNHDDGRLYHPVITEKVLALLKGREKERDYRRKRREASAPDGPGRTVRGGQAVSGADSGADCPSDEVEVEGEGKDNPATPGFDLSKKTGVALTTVSNPGLFGKREDQKPAHWQVPPMSDQRGLENWAREHGVEPQRYSSYRELFDECVAVAQDENDADRRRLQQLKGAKP